MNQSTTTQSKKRFRPVKVAAVGLPGGPLPASSIAQDPTARPAIIRTVADVGTGDQSVTVRLLRQDEMSQPKPRMLPAQRLERYVEDLRSAERAQADPVNEPPSASRSLLDGYEDSPIVTWRTPQARRAIDLSEAALTQSEANHHLHSAHSASDPYLQGWSGKPAADKAKADAQLKQATALDEQLRQLELRIEKLRAKEEQAKFAVQTDREKAILANPNTGELVTAISAAIVSALQEKPESEVLPKAKNLFEQSLQQHAVTIDQHAIVAAKSADPSQLASEAMFSSIAAQRQQAMQPVKIAASNSSAGTLAKLRTRIGDYQRMMTQASTDEAATLVSLTQNGPNAVGVADVKHSLTELDQQVAPAEETTAEENQAPLVQFTAPEDAAVPVKIASWDVKDFRWSASTNRMLDNGGKAIANLLEVTLDRTAAKTKRIVVAGAGRGQGTTTIAVSLARAANAAGYRTLLIDADVASPALSQVAGLSAKTSWLNGIGTELPIGEMVIRSKKSNLCLMPLTSDVQRVTWPRFIFDNLGALLAKSEEYFDLVLVDAGPASQLLDELSNPEQLLDTMVLVDSTAKLKEVEVYQNRLKTFGVNNLVLAENRKG